MLELVRRASRFRGGAEGLPADPRAVADVLNEDRFADDWERTTVNVGCMTGHDEGE